MKIKYNAKLSIPYFLIYILLPCTLSFLFKAALGINMENSKIFIYTFIIGSLVKLIGAIPLLIGLISGLFVVTIFSLYYFFPHSYLILLTRLGEFLLNIKLHIQGKEDIAIGNEMVVWVILVILLCVFTDISIYKAKKPIYLVPLYYVFYIYYWYVYIDKAYLMMVICTFLIIILFALQGYKEEKLSFEYRAWMRTAICYSIIAIVASLTLPNFDAFVKWPWLEKQSYKVFPIMADMRSDGTYDKEGQDTSVFGLWETGFNPDDTQLGGPVKENHTEVMKVEAPSSLYLRGAVKDFYQGNKWSKSSWNKNRQWLGTSLLGEIDANQLITINIRYSNFSSNTAFTTYQPASIKFKNNRTIFADEDNQITIPSGINKGEEYTLTSVLPGTDESYQREREVDLANYLQLPNTITPRTYQLAKDITKNISDDYNKALAIEEHLRENYTYSLDVPYLPKEKEFVDNFLFEEKEGYCTYYATSMVVLLRAEGIPSRYIEGYKMPQESEDGIYTITQKQAHAWVEAYIEGKGWVTLEPTSSYDLSEREEGVLNQEEEGTNESTGQEEDLEDDLSKEEHKLEESENEDRTELNQENIEEETKVIEETNEGKIEGEIKAIEQINKNMKRIFPMLKKYILVLILVPIPIWLVHKLLVSYKKRKKYYKNIERFTPKSSAINIYGETIKLLEKLGYSRNPGETPQEYAIRIEPKMNLIQSDYPRYKGNSQINFTEEIAISSNEYGFKEITDIYLRARYSAMDISIEERDVLLEYNDCIERNIKLKLGKVKYVYNKYICGNF